MDGGFQNLGASILISYHTMSMFTARNFYPSDMRCQLKADTTEGKHNTGELTVSYRADEEGSMEQRFSSRAKIPPTNSVVENKVGGLGDVFFLLLP